MHSSTTGVHTHLWQSEIDPETKSLFHWAQKRSWLRSLLEHLSFNYLKLKFAHQLLEEVIKALLSDETIKSIIIDQEAVLDCLYNRKRNVEAQPLNPFNQLANPANPTDESVPKDVCSTKTFTLILIISNTRCL